MKSVEWITGLVLSLVFILTVYECKAFRIEHGSSTPYDTWLKAKQWFHHQEQQHPQQQQQQRSLRSNSPMHKRGCKGFPCMYTHMGGSAGNASIKKAKLMLLRECVADPMCSPIGKRSVRSQADGVDSLRRYLQLG